MRSAAHALGLRVGDRARVLRLLVVEVRRLAERLGGLGEPLQVVLHVRVEREQRGQRAAGLRSVAAAWSAGIVEAEVAMAGR